MTNINNINYVKNVNAIEKNQKKHNVAFGNHKIDESANDEFKSSKKEKKSNSNWGKIGAFILAAVAGVAFFKFKKGKKIATIKNPIDRLKTNYDDLFNGIKTRTDEAKTTVDTKIRTKIKTERPVDNSLRTKGEAASVKTGEKIVAQTHTPERIAKIQTGTNGKIRKLNELNSAHLEEIITHQLKSVSVNEVETFINSLPKSEQALATRVMNKMTQFGNMQSIDTFADELAQYGNKVLYTDKPSLTSTLEYLGQSKHALKNTSISFSQNSGVCILDDLMLQRLETDKAFLDKIKATPDITLATPEGWISGFNPFNQTTNYNKKFADVIKEVGELMSSNPNLKENEAISAILNKNVLERVSKLGINKRVNIITNANSTVGNKATVSAERIANQLNHTQFGADDIEAITSQFHSDYKPYINELLAHGLNINSPKAMSLKLQKMHEGILKLNNGSLDGVYYIVPQKGKSYSTVAMQYQIANGVPASKVLTISDIKQLPLDAKKIVILDDVAGSGDSLVSALNSVQSHLPQGHKVDDIIISPIITTEQAMKKFSYNSYKGKPISVVSGEKCPSFTLSEYYKSLSQTDKMMIDKVMCGQGYGQNGLSIAFPYMSPDNNNNFFASYFANKFTLNGLGVKNKLDKSLYFKFLTQQPNAA